MKRLFIVCVGVLVFIISCEKNTVMDPADQYSQVDLTIEGLQSLGDSSWYEGWLVWGDNNEFKQSVGIFTVDNQGNLIPDVFEINLGYLQQAQNFIITIEEDDVPGYQITRTVQPDTILIDSIAGPSNYTILGALINANSGILSIGHPMILDYDFETVGGTYMLNTPTDTLNDNLTSGIWFITIDTSGTISKGLTLPTAINGWYYEGWVDINGIPVSTGIFRNPAVRDESNTYSGLNGSAYNFPGEDFLQNAPSGLSFPVSLNTSEVYIALNPPHPAKSNSPFTITHVLQATIPATASAKTLYSMTTDINAFPSGALVINVKLYE